MYKSFKFNNMWHTFQWMLFSNRRQLITYFIGIIIATFVGGELLVLDLNHSNIAARDIYFMKTIMLLVYILFICLPTVCGCCMERIRCLTLWRVSSQR